MLGLFLRSASSLRLLLNVAIAFIPLAALGLLFGKGIKAHLFNAPVVASTFILGAFVILWAEARQKYTRVETVEEMTWLDALKLGIAQAFEQYGGDYEKKPPIITGGGSS